MSELLTVKETAALLRLKERTILEYLRTGKLKGVNIGSEGPGKRWRITREAVDLFIKERMS